MKTTTKSKYRIPVLLSILCAGLVTAFLSGCAEGPYVTAYDGGYYPAGYYTRYSYYDPYAYSYYGPAYDTTIVRSGVRYNDAYWSSLLSDQDCLRRLVLICDARLADASVRSAFAGAPMCFFACVW